MGPGDDDYDDEYSTDNNITLYILPLISEYFTHIILFILDSIVCELGVWTALIQFSQKDGAFPTNYQQLNGYTVHSSTPYFILYSIILPNPLDKMIPLKIRANNTDPELSSRGAVLEDPSFCVYFQVCLGKSFGEAGRGNTAVF